MRDVNFVRLNVMKMFLNLKNVSPTNGESNWRPLIPLQFPYENNPNTHMERPAKSEQDRLETQLVKYSGLRSTYCPDIWVTGPSILGSRRAQSLEESLSFLDSVAVIGLREILQSVNDTQISIWNPRTTENGPTTNSESSLAHSSFPNIPACPGTHVSLIERRPIRVSDLTHHPLSQTLPEHATVR